MSDLSEVEPSGSGDESASAEATCQSDSITDFIRNSNPTSPAGQHQGQTQSQSPSPPSPPPDIHVARSRRTRRVDYIRKIRLHSPLAKSLRLRIPKLPHPLRAPSLFIFLPEFGVIASDGADKGKILSTTEFKTPTHTAKPDRPLKLLSSLFARLLEQVEYGSSAAAKRDIAEFIEFVLTIAPQALVDENPAWQIRTREQVEEAERQRIAERERDKLRRKWRGFKKRGKAKKNREKRKAMTEGDREKRREQRKIRLKAKAEKERAKKKARKLANFRRKVERANARAAREKLAAESVGVGELPDATLPADKKRKKRKMRRSKRRRKNGNGLIRQRRQQKVAITSPETTHATEPVELTETAETPPPTTQGSDSEPSSPHQ